MQFFILWQRSDAFLSHPYQSRGMVVIAPNEETARAMAQQNEDEERDDGLSWSLESASCEVLDTTGDARVIMVA